MKTKQEWAIELKGFLILEDHQVSHEMIDHIQQDAQPKLDLIKVAENIADSVQYNGKNFIQQTDRDDCVKMVIEKLSQFALPKWVKGDEAKGWPEGTIMLLQREKGPTYIITRRIKAQTSDWNQFRFLSLDDILAQPWPK